MPSDNRERRSKHGYEQIQEQPHFNAESNQKRDVPTYPALTFKTFLWHTLPLILCNLLCEGLFALTLKLYGEKRVLERPNRIWFNTILLSLAAAISTGVGFLLDQIGYMLRGILLMRGGNTKREVGHILRGTIGSYILLVWVHLRRSSCSVVTTLVWFFVVVNVLGRLSVGFFGVTYTLDYEDIVTDKGLALTVWPTPGDVEFKVDDYFEAKGLSNATVLDLLRNTANVKPSPPQDTFNRTDLILEWLNITGLDLSVGNPYANDSTVSYTYQLRESGYYNGSDFKDRRSIVIVTECTIPQSQEYFDEMKYSSSTFYPIQVGIVRVGKNELEYVCGCDPSRGGGSSSMEHDITMQQVAPFKDDFSGPVMDRRQDRLDEGAAAVVDTVLEGWMLLSHPRNGKECGKACTKLGISAGKMKVNDLGFSKYENGIDYQCQITVNYSSPFEFPVEVVPGESLLLTLSSFLVGNETRQDEKDPGRDNKTSFKDRQWLPLWTTTGDQNGEPLPPLAMAGVLAHSVALVVQRIGNGREQKTVKKKRSTVMAILGINWKRVGAVLGGIAGLQILVAVLAGRITIGTLEVNDDVDSVMEILNSQKFQTKEAEEQAWVTEQAAGQKELTYRFTGVVGRGDAPGKS